MVGRVFWQYRILSELGRGGMGVVYLAEHTVLGRRVAIKFPTGVANHRRLLSEARAASALYHPNIAAIHDCGELDGAPFVVMDLVEGSSLAELLAEGPPPVERAIEIVSQVGEALGEAHRCHIIHRDIKPSNIRIDKRGAVKVVDFGLAKTLEGNAAETQTLEGTISGTPRYMSPEQARGESGDERSDLFSLGALLYECVTGKPAFPGATAAEALGNVLHAEPPLSALPQGVRRVVAKALAKDPAQRYQTAEEFLRDLSRREAPRLRLRRTHLLAAGALLALVLVWLLWPDRSYQPRPEALEWYRQGTAAVRDGAYYSATKALERAVGLDGRFAPAHARLAEAYNELDDTTRAQQQMLLALASEAGRLSGADRLLVQAIHHVLTGEFAAAAGFYRRLLDQVPESDKPRVYVDLGRACEQDQKPRGAMNCYREAARRAPDYPAAFLRLGVLCGRQRDIAGAGAAFDRAESLYSALSNVEGATEVVYQRSLLASQLGRIGEADALLRRAFEMADAAGNQYQAVAGLLQMSFVSVKKGESAEAERQALQALELAHKMGLERMAARALPTLGNVYAMRGDKAQAEKTFAQALEEARRLNAPRAEARALLSLGSLHISAGEYDRGIGEVERSLPFFERGGFEKERSQALYLLGRGRRAKGDLAGALRTFEDQLAVARSAGDTDQLALTYEGIARIYMEQERYGDALAHFEQRLALSRSQGNQPGVAYGLNQYGSALARLGRYSEAEAAFQEARVRAARSGAADLVDSIDIALAEMALSQRRFASARELARQLETRADKLWPDTRCNVQRILGAAAVGLGARADGARATGRALELARASRGRPLTAALIAHAEALMEAGEPAKALAAAREAQAECARAGQRESEAAALAVAARAAPGAEARPLAARALECLDAMAATLKEPDRKSFNSRPDVQVWRRQAHAVLERH